MVVYSDNEKGFNEDWRIGTGRRGTGRKGGHWRAKVQRIVRGTGGEKKKKLDERDFKQGKDFQRYGHHKKICQDVLTYIPGRKYVRYCPLVV